MKGRLKKLFGYSPFEKATPSEKTVESSQDQNSTEIIRETFGSPHAGSVTPSDYYPALFARLRTANGEAVQSGEDEKTARIIEAISTRVILEYLRERRLTGMLSLGRNGEYQAIVAGRYSARSQNAYNALLSAFRKADKAGVFSKVAIRS